MLLYVRRRARRGGAGCRLGHRAFADGIGIYVTGAEGWRIAVGLCGTGPSGTGVIVIIALGAVDRCDRCRVVAGPAGPLDPRCSAGIVHRPRGVGGCRGWSVSFDWSAGACASPLPLAALDRTGDERAVTRRRPAAIAVTPPAQTATSDRRRVVRDPAARRLTSYQVLESRERHASHARARPTRPAGVPGVERSRCRWAGALPGARYRGLRPGARPAHPSRVEHRLVGRDRHCCSRSSRRAGSPRCALAEMRSARRPAPRRETRRAPARHGSESRRVPPTPRRCRTQRSSSWASGLTSRARRAGAAPGCRRR